MLGARSIRLHTNDNNRSKVQQRYNNANNATIGEIDNNEGKAVELTECEEFHDMALHLKIY